VPASQFARSLFPARNWDFNLPYEDKDKNNLIPNGGWPILIIQDGLPNTIQLPHIMKDWLPVFIPTLIFING
jgi:hypothetical protein